MKPRTRLTQISFTRRYATRRPERPPPKIIDPLTSSPNASIQVLPDGVSFIHRPPPTAPTPFSTTLLPASPLLRPRTPGAPSSSSATASTSANAEEPTEYIPVPPRMRQPREFSSNRVLTEADFAKMRELRASNPKLYTRTRLAKEFSCPPFLIAQQVPLDNKSKLEALEKRETEHEEIRSKWGEQKSMVRAVKKERRKYW